MLAFCCAAATGFGAAATKRWRSGNVTHWWVLAGALALISLDEVAQKHKTLSAYLDYSGVLFYSWVIPAGIFVALFGLSYVRFLLRLARRLGHRLDTAGAVYVVGLLALELPLG